MKLKDKLRKGHWADVRARLASLASASGQLADRIKTTCPRNERNFTLFSIAARSAIELQRCSESIDGSVEYVAWSARNLFELNLVLRHVLLSPDNLKQWCAQAGSDEMEIHEGAIRLAEDASGADAQRLHARIQELHGILSRHGMRRGRLPHASEMAKEAGLADEYAAFFKLFSKYVHPTSWLVNRSPDVTQAWHWRTIFTIQAQLYAHDTQQRIKGALGS